MKRTAAKPRRVSESGNRYTELMRSKYQMLRLPLIPTVSLAAFALALVVGSAALWGSSSGTDQPPKETPVSDMQPVDWQTVDSLIADQKFQAALDTVQKLREFAVAAEDDEQWTRALVEAAKLRVALHGYETAVRDLIDSPWPSDPTSRAILDLYTAQAMVAYSEAYGWEIRSRERVISDEEVDLKRWTMDQIVATPPPTEPMPVCGRSVRAGVTPRWGTSAATSIRTPSAAHPRHLA